MSKDKKVKHKDWAVISGRAEAASLILEDLTIYTFFDDDFKATLKETRDSIDRLNNLAFDRVMNKKEKKEFYGS